MTTVQPVPLSGLQDLVHSLAELSADGFHIHVTLLVRGVVLVGRLAPVEESKDVFAMGLISALRRSAPDLDPGKFDDIVKSTFGPALRPGSAITPTDALLLDNVRILNGGLLTPTGSGIAMYIDLAAIDGFSLMKLDDAK